MSLINIAPRFSCHKSASNDFQMIEASLVIAERQSVRGATITIQLLEMMIGGEEMQRAQGRHGGLDVRGGECPELILKREPTLRLV